MIGRRSLFIAPLLACVSPQGWAQSLTLAAGESLNTRDIGHSSLLLNPLQVLAEHTFQCRRQLYQPVDDAKQFAHVFRTEAAFVQIAHQPNLPGKTVGRVAVRLPRLKMGQYHLRERVAARPQHGLVSREV